MVREDVIVLQVRLGEISRRFDEVTVGPRRESLEAPFARARQETRRSPQPWQTAAHAPRNRVTR